jgi:hypothetical protein
LVPRVAFFPPGVVFAPAVVWPHVAQDQGIAGARRVTIGTGGRTFGRSGGGRGGAGSQEIFKTGRFPVLVRGRVAGGDHPTDTPETLGMTISKKIRSEKVVSIYTVFNPGKQTLLERILEKLK